MAIIKAKARQDSSVGRVSESGEVYTRATRDGSLITLDWKTAMIMEGRGFICKIGSLTTPIAVAGSGNVVDEDRPDWMVGVPSGTSILPFCIDMQMKLTAGTTDDNELDMLIRVDQDTMQPKTTGTSTTTYVPYNLNTLHSRASNCYFIYTFSATMTASAVCDIELAHVTKIYEEHSTVGEQWMEYALHYEPKTVPIINGPANIIGYAGSSKGASMFHQVQWIELPTSLIRES